MSELSSVLWAPCPLPVSGHLGLSLAPSLRDMQLRGRLVQCGRLATAC